MSLSTFDYVNGLFALIHATVMIIVGLRIASKYFNISIEPFY